MGKIILPIIKKVMPVLLAKEITDVQSIGPVKSYFIQTNHNEEVPDGFLVVDIKWIRFEIYEWLERQNPNKWRKSASNHKLLTYIRYIISEDLYTLLVLRWS